MQAAHLHTGNSWIDFRQEVGRTVDRWLGALGRTEDLISLRRAIVRELTSLQTRLATSLSGTYVLQEFARPRDRFADQILAAMQPENRSGIYVLGCYDSTKTVYTQQCRALVLTYALLRGQVLEPGKTLGVVGGGFAGLTAALAAAKQGVKVTIFEKAPKLLPLQVDSMTRYLSPHLADWPQPTCLELRANLPILPWSANYANIVTQEILSNSDLTAHQHRGQILVQCNARIRRVEEDYRRGGQMGLVYVEGRSGALQERFNAVIIAVGYGLESGTVYGVPTPYYWENDSAKPDRKIYGANAAPYSNLGSRGWRAD